MTFGRSRPRGFVGVLESPLDDGEPLLGEQLEVRGWALAAATVRRIVARVGEGDEAEAVIGLQRSDVATAFSSVPGAARSGFVARVSLLGLAPGEHTLRVRVDDGSSGAHGWQRTMRIADADAVYREWQARRVRQRRADVEHGVQAPAQVAWIVRCPSPADLDAAEATAESLRRAGDGRWRVHVLDAGTGEAGLRALRASLEGKWVGVLDAGDRAYEGAGARLERLLGATDAALVYADHDHASPDGAVDPVFKPGWSPLLSDHPAIASRGWLVRRERLDEPAWSALGRPPPTAPALPRVFSGSGARALRVPELLFTLRRDAVPVPTRAAAPAPSGRVAVVIPSRLADRPMMARCLDGLRSGTDHRELDIVVALNNLGATTRAEAESFLSPWSVRVTHSDAPFNWSALNNAAANSSQAPWLLFLNDDVEPVGEGWLDAMLARAQDEAVGAVGAVLRYPDGRIQHAGVYVHGGDRPECRHTFRHCSGDEPRVRRWLSHDLAQTAVTGACLLTRRRDFEALGGFDEALPLVYNDVDYCLRLAERGLVCMVAADAVLRHHEGLSRGGLAEDADRDRFTARWARSLPVCDPHSHPALMRDRDDWMFDPSRIAPDTDPIP